jgi:hypothetical protein
MNMYELYSVAFEGEKNIIVIIIIIIIIIIIMLSFASSLI